MRAPPPVGTAVTACAVPAAACLHGGWRELHRRRRRALGASCGRHGRRWVKPCCGFEGVGGGAGSVGEWYIQQAHGAKKQRNLACPLPRCNTVNICHGAHVPAHTHVQTRTGKSQRLVGFTTIYNFYAWPTSSRPRVAQVRGRMPSALGMLAAGALITPEGTTGSACVRELQPFVRGCPRLLSHAAAAAACRCWCCRLTRAPA